MRKDDKHKENIAYWKYNTILFAGSREFNAFFWVSEYEGSRLINAFDGDKRKSISFHYMKIPLHFLYIFDIALILSFFIIRKEIKIY